VFRINPNPDTADGGRGTLLERQLESLSDWIVRRDFLPFGCPVDADVATASFEISALEAFTNWTDARYPTARRATRP
jgi:hypothetical protein